MRKFTLFLIILMGVTAGADAQVSKTTARIPAETQVYLHKLEKSKVAEVRKEARLFVSCSSDVVAKSVAERVRALGAKPQGTVGRYVMVSTPVALVEKIAALDGVTYVSKGSEVSLKTNLSRQVTGVDKVQAGTAPLPQAFTGKGVVVGILDTGFDFTNPVFKDAEGNLRIKAVYCAAMTPKEGDAPVVTLDETELAGVVTTDAEAIIAMETDYTANSHGTHCAATAAATHWNGYGGMAPEADIVLCPFSKTDKEEQDVENRAYYIMQSIQYVRDYAQRQGKPFVISMSLNQQDGPHDGTSQISSMLEQMVVEGSNIVLASSNEGGDDCYVNYQYAANDTLHTIVNGNVQAYAYTRQPGEISLQIGLLNLQTLQEEPWRSKPLRSIDGNLSIGFDFTNGETITKGDIPADVIEDLREKLSELGSSYVMLNVERLEDGRTTAKLRSMQVMTKLFVLHIACPEGSVVDLWGDNRTNFAALPGGYYTKGNSSVSVGDWCTGGSIISVGSWAAKTSFTNINGEEQAGIFDETLGRYSEFSSYGIDMKGHHHPFISTPGSLIVSATNHFDETYSLGNSDDVVAADENGYTWASMSGTSMATPTAAGIIALWLQAKPTLTYEEIKEAMAETANTDEWTEADPIHYGHGKLDAYKGLLRVLGITTSIPSLSQYQPKGVTFRLNGSLLTIDGAADGTPVRIYTTDGRLVGSSAISGGTVSLPTTATSGIYAVQVGTLGSTLIRK